MLTRIMLSFQDKEMASNYERANQWYFVRSTIMISATLFVIALAVQIDSATAVESHPNSMLLTIVGWASFAIFLSLCLALRKFLFLQHLVCPILTIYVTFISVFAVEDSNSALGVDDGVLFARALIMTAALFYVLVMFNHCWLVNFFVFILCITFSLVQASSALDDTGA